MIWETLLRTRLAPMVSAVPDVVWPATWRLAWPDGELSNMANVARIKDAAMVICQRGPPARNRQRFHWKQKRSETAVGSPYSPSIDKSLPEAA
jgi:hypothetical protein